MVWHGMRPLSMTCAPTVPGTRLSDMRPSCDRCNCGPEFRGHLCEIPAETSNVPAPPLPAAAAAGTGCEFNMPMLTVRAARGG